MDRSKIPFCDELEKLVKADLPPEKLDELAETVRVCHRNTPEALVKLISGWKVLCADTMPVVNPEGKTEMQQILHLTHLVPRRELLAEAKVMLEEIDEIDEEAIKRAKEEEMRARRGSPVLVGTAVPPRMPRMGGGNRGPNGEPTPF